MTDCSDFSGSGPDDAEKCTNPNNGINGGIYLYFYL
jgi:hypothetical protein